uniref:Uncharacterized protein n=1 Tax=Cacopsylla melanoneura TaxID=428564 RepID=A0A8D8VNP2_9HEMI
MINLCHTYMYNVHRDKNTLYAQYEIDIYSIRNNFRSIRFRYQIKSIRSYWVINWLLGTHLSNDPLKVSALKWIYIWSCKSSYSVNLEVYKYLWCVFGGVYLFST